MYENCIISRGSHSRAGRRQGGWLGAYQYLLSVLPTLSGLVRLVGKDAIHKVLDSLMVFGLSVARVGSLGKPMQQVHDTANALTNPRRPCPQPLPQALCVPDGHALVPCARQQEHMRGMLLLQEPLQLLFIIPVFSMNERLDPLGQPAHSGDDTRLQ